MRNGRRASSEQALELWLRYHESADRQLRDRLVLTFAPLVKYIVFKKVRQLPPRCEVDDLISCGLEALIRSLDRYDPGRGATLEQFLWTRVHGATENFFAEEGRHPDAAELAERLGVAATVLQRHNDELAACDVASLNTTVEGREGAAVERINTLVADDRELDPEQAAALHEAKDKFRRAFRSLSEREREVAVLLYVNNLTLREIGNVLGVTESRVCQIHTQLKDTLRARLAGESALFAEVA